MCRGTTNPGHPHHEVRRGLGAEVTPFAALRDVRLTRQLMGVKAIPRGPLSEGDCLAFELDPSEHRRPDVPILAAARLETRVALPSDAGSCR